MRKLEIETTDVRNRVMRATGIVIGQKAAIAIVLATIGRRGLGDHMARKLAAKHGATGAYRLARQLEAAN